jgi:hypothetical protein
MGIYQPVVTPIKTNQNVSSSNDELSDEITLLAGQINAANYRFLKLIAEFDRREAWGGFGIRSCAHWLNWKCGISLGPAREKVRVARCLDGLPAINEAFAGGEISYSKVRAMTRVATDDNEAYLLMIARHGTAQHMEQLVRQYQKVDHLQQPKAERDQHAARELVCYQDEDGQWIIHAKLPAEVGALVVKAIDAVMAVQEENVSAETSGELVSETVLETMPEKTFPQKRADALEALAEHYIATVANNSGDGLKTLAGSERCQLMLHVNVNTLQAFSHSHLDGHWISPDTARRLACDASVVTVLEDDSGQVLNIGRRSRTIPPAIKRALQVRDKSCRFPGCCETRYVDAHHIQHWADGGETSLDNLVTLCRYHHRELHKGNFQLELAPQTGAGQKLLFSTVSEKRIESSFMPQFQVDGEGTGSLLEASSDFLQQHWPLIDSNTAITAWQGERMDMGMAVDGVSKGMSM